MVDFAKVVAEDQGIVLLIGIVLGVLYGWRAWVLLPNRSDLENAKVPDGLRWRWPWAVHDHIVQIIGASAGSLCLVALATRQVGSSGGSFGLQDFILFLFVLLGLNGNLPTLLHGFAASFQVVVDRLVHIIAKEKATP